MNKYFLFYFILIFIPSALFAQISVEAWQADLNFIKKELPVKHPDLFRYYPQAQFEQDLTNLAANLQGKTELQRALGLQEILAKVQDAHTTLDMIPLLQKDRIIPFAVLWSGDGVYVVATVKKFERMHSRQVKQINGMPVEQALRKLGRFVSAENESGLRRDAPQLLRFPTVFKAAGISITDTLRFGLVNPTDTTKLEIIAIHPIDFSDQKAMQPLTVNAKSNPVLQPQQSPFWSQWLEADNILYVKYEYCISAEMVRAAGDSATAAQMPSWNTFADSTLSFLKQRPGARLLLDLRGNAGGGNSDGLQFAKTIDKISALNRKDRLFVVTDYNTFDAGAQVAAAFAANTKATLLGDMPSSRINSFSVPRQFVLPNARLMVSHATKSVVVAKSKQPSLIPDVLLPQRFAEFKSGQDGIFEYVRKAGSKE